MDAKTEAALSAGKALAKQAIDDLTSTDEEKSEKAANRKKTLIKYGVIGVVGIVAILALMSVLAKLWMYALGLLVVGGIGAAGYFYTKPKLRALKERATAKSRARKELEEAQSREQALVDAKVAKEKKLEDELAALKKRA